MLYFLFNDNETSLIFCNSFWFSILTQGIEQSTTQLKIDLDKILNDIINNHDLNSNITLLINLQNIFFLEVYVTFYFMFSFENTINIFEYFKTIFEVKLMKNKLFNVNQREQLSQIFKFDYYF